jgi:hypothetical protein
MKTINSNSYPKIDRSHKNNKNAGGGKQNSSSITNESMQMTKGTQSAECSTTRPTCRLFLQQEAIFVNCERALRAEK